VQGRTQRRWIRRAFLVAVWVPLIVCAYVAVVTWMAVHDLKRATFDDAALAAVVPVEQIREPDRDYFDGVVTIRTNPGCYRGVYHEPTHPPGITRIVALGDSYTEGLHLSAEETWPHHLQEALPADHQVLNFGVSGFNTRQEVRWLALKALRYTPDLVVLQVSPNDTEPESIQYHYISGSRDFLRSRLGPLFNRHTAVLFERLIAGTIYETYERHRAAHPEDERMLVEPIRELHDLSVREGFQIVCIAYPGMRPEMEQVLTAVLAELSIPYHRLWIEAGFGRPEHVLGPGDGHPSAAGNRLVASYLARQLAETPGDLTGAPANGTPRR